MSESPEQLTAECKRVVGALPGVRNVEVEITSRVASHTPAGKQPVPGVASVIAVASGKGGVGKSTVAIGLAAALLREGAAVGLLDADLYGPSLPVMMGGIERLQMNEKRQVIPALINGIPMVSVGLLAEKGAPVIWRGPLVSKMIEELLFNVTWPTLDYLVVDLPPGTGDAQLTLAQRAPLSGVVMVTTPQDVALEDVERAAGMFQRVNILILGVVENMSYYVCPSCGRREEIFSSGGGEQLAARLGIPLLAQIPILTGLRQRADRGESLLMEDSHHDISAEFARIARGVASTLAVLAHGSAG
jgi:ATP-binding protein involved in chromosome partitioning